MSTSTIRTHRIASSDVESGNSAPLPVEFAQSEVQRAEIRLADVVKWNAERIDGARSWLAETQRRLRCAQMIQRRANPVVVGRAIPAAPWLEPPAKPGLFDWQRKITIDAGRVSDD
jgi:hypothetical protein